MSLAKPSSPTPVHFPKTKNIGVEGFIFIVGLVLIAVYGLVRFIYEPSWQEKEAAIRATMAAEHAKVCDQLGKPAATPDGLRCLELLDGLYTRHKETFIADNSEI
jgi:hypothetical protein